ncbi:MAG: carboxypeptidase regulatory-like domain-containing protein [Gemmatimonadales bacterium]
MKSSMIGLGMLSIGVGLVFGCGGAGRGGGEAENGEPAAGQDGSDTQSRAESPLSDGYTVVDVTNGGTIRGTVTFVGTVPPPQTAEVTEDSETCGATRVTQPVNVSAAGGLGNVLVSLVDITSGAAIAPPETAPVLDQRECRFEPHIQVVSAGAAMHILNNDPFTHNIHTSSFENRPINRAQPAALREIEVTFAAADKVRVRCDIHGWMNAWIIVVDHPYHAITGDGGGFVIENVPPGTYTLEVWHETLGANSRSVTVTPDGTTDINLTLSSEG